MEAHEGLRSQSSTGYKLESSSHWGCIQAYTNHACGWANLHQFPSVSTEAKLTSRQHVGISCKAKQVPCESKAAQGKQIWRVKPGASPREASCEANAQPRISREDKGKAPLSVDSVAYAASTRGAQNPFSHKAKLAAWCNTRHEASLVSPNQKALVSSAKFAPLSEVKGVPPSVDSFAYAASTLRDASKVLRHKARTKVLYNASYVGCNMKIKTPLCAKSEATIASLPAHSS